MNSGYYRFPAIRENIVVFCSEDDLWSVSADGGTASRLTSSLSEIIRPCISPDGRWIAFTAREEGHYELYVMSADSGQIRRLTYFGRNTFPVGWSRDGQTIVFASTYGEPFFRTTKIYSISPEGGPVEQLPVGAARSISFGNSGGIVLGRNGGSDPAWWKRYRGGTAGVMWIDRTGDGSWNRLLPELKSHLTCPMWIGERIYFLSDHEGYGNIYSCTPDGGDITRHTDHTEFYARNASSDGKRIVYHAGGDIYMYDPTGDTDRKIEIAYNSPRTQRNRKFINGADYLQGYGLHPEGHSVALTMRGKAFTMGLFNGPASQHGESTGIRYRLTRYLNDGKRLVAVCDKDGEDTLVILGHDGNDTYIEGLDIGRPISLEVSPKADVVAFANQRNQIITVDLTEGTMKVIDTSKTLHDTYIAWSPDGKWLAYNHAETAETSYLMIADAESDETHQVTEPLLHDVRPSFDPEGRYLYFLSYREFNPVYDNMRFDIGFPRGMRPYLITLKSETPNPFIVDPKPPKEPFADKERKRKRKGGSEISIDFEGITRRMLAFPMREGLYTQIVGSFGKVYTVSNPVEGSLDSSIYDDPVPSGVLESYDFETQKTETVASAISEITMSANSETVMYRSAKKLRAFAAGTKPDNGVEKSGRDGGWVDLGRPSVAIVPSDEWKQMFREAWRLQREYFWSEGMLDLDWDAVLARYAPLIDRIGARSEFADIVWEMHGELGTSHAYEMGGDYRKSPMYAQGFLGADFRFDEESNAWKVSHIVLGDCWSDMNGSPLEKPGVNIREGDSIVSVNGRSVTRTTSPLELLVNTAGKELAVQFVPQGKDKARTVTVKAIGNDTPVRYREWVESNRRKVHEATNGKVGYIHVPNMGPVGYSEFFRGFLSECGRGSLIVDVRFNGGGHVSQLLLEQLARTPIGYGIARHRALENYPESATNGPIVALTNEYAGSDGDIFSHAFKLMKLGPLIGKRTWGGVVGIWPRNSLADGSMTTQPEFSTWFTDVGWGVENYGTDPDIEVDITPQDYAAGRDSQLERGIQEALKLYQSQPPTVPNFGKLPVMSPAPLPKQRKNES